MRVDPRQLNLLLEVARAGSFSSAARVVGLTRPAISTAIAALERSLGARLLDRGRKGAVPTRAGEIAIRRAEAIDALIAQTRAEIDLDRDGIAGPLHIAGTPGALMSLIPKALKRCKQRYAALEIRVSESTNRDDLVTQLRARQIDIAICTVGFEPPADDIEEIPIAQDVFELVVGRDHPLRAPVVSLDELSDLAWVLPVDQEAFRRHIDVLFITHEVAQPRDIVLCDSLATTKEIIRQTGYVTILPRNVVAAEIEAGSLRTMRLKQWLVTHKVGVRVMRDVGLSPAASAFVAALKEQATDT